MQYLLTKEELDGLKNKGKAETQKKERIFFANKLEEILNKGYLQNPHYSSEPLAEQIQLFIEHLRKTT